MQRKKITVQGPKPSQKYNGRASSRSAADQTAAISKKHTAGKRDQLRSSSGAPLSEHWRPQNRCQSGFGAQANAMAAANFRKRNQQQPTCERAKATSARCKTIYLNRPICANKNICQRCVICRCIASWSGRISLAQVHGETRAHCSPRLN